MIIADVEFKSEYLKYYYKWLEIVELEHNEEVFLLYLKDCFKIKKPKYNLNDFKGFKLTYYNHNNSYHRIYYDDTKWDYLDWFIEAGEIVIQEYENFRDRST